MIDEPLTYRHVFTRRLTHPVERLNFDRDASRALRPRKLGICMLNPSTAGAAVDAENDATVRRLLYFGRAWGYDELWGVNEFALQATDPRRLLALSKTHPPEVLIGAENDHAIATIARNTDLFIVAWGNHGGLLGRDREVLGLLQRLCDVYHLGLTGEGHPRHPLRLPKTTRPQLWFRRGDPIPVLI